MMYTSTRSTKGNIMTTENITPANITIRTPRTHKITRFTKIITSLIIAPFVISALVGVGIGVAHAINPPKASTTVSDFNDGFATSKQDDCQRGSAYACQWLKGNTK